MDRQEELDRWRAKDRADLDAVIERLPAGWAEVGMRRALDLFDLAGAATNGEERVAPLSAPSRITSTAEWMEDLRQDLSPVMFFERRVLELRPDLLPDHAAITAHPWWPSLRAGVARVVTWQDASRELLDQAGRVDQAG